MRIMVHCLLAAALFVVPSTWAHGSPNPIEAEDLILDDEATDTTIAWDGMDIQTVHIREAYLTGENGIVVRWTLWGSTAFGGAAEETVTLAFDELDAPLEWISEDNGATWSGSGTVLEVEFEPDTLEDADGQQIPSNNVQFQAFVPFADLPVATGDALSNAVAYAYADDVAVDVAPGGYYPPGSDQEAQDPGAESVRVIDSLRLDGPDRYTKSTLTYQDGVLTVEVENLIEASGQHIFVKTPAEPTSLNATHDHDVTGNHIGGGQAAEPGQDLDFTVQMPEFDVTQVFIETDLGGREVFWVRSDGTVSETELASLGPDDDVETPGVPVALVAVALAFIAALRRR